MVRTEERKITLTKKGAVLGLNPNYLNEIGLHPGKRYTVIYDDKKKELIISDKQIDSVTLKQSGS